MLRSTVAVRRIAIEWQKLVPPTHKSGTNKFRDLEIEIDNMWREIGEAPTAVSNIDWSYWASKVEDKKAFEEIKAKHEAKSFAPVKAAVYQTPEQFEAALVNAKKEAAMYTSLIADLEAEAEKTLQVKTEWPFWTTQQHMDSVPGVEAEYDRLADGLRAFVPFEVEESLNSIDLQTTIIDKIEAGLVPEIDISTYDILPPESPVRLAIEQEYKDFAARISASGATAAPLATILDQARASHAAANPVA